MPEILSRFYTACPQACGGFTQDEVIDFLSTDGGRKFLGLDLADAVEILLGICPKIGQHPCTQGFKESLILEYHVSGACQYIKVFKNDWCGIPQFVGEITPASWYNPVW